MAKITPSDRSKRDTVVVKTTQSKSPHSAKKWWKAGSKQERALQMVETASFLKEQLQFRYRQASIYSRLYGNLPLLGVAGSNLAKVSNTNSTLPLDRPTMNVVQSCVDTLVSRITQARPRPTFLTDNGNYKQRRLAKDMNTFISGEFYQTDAYDVGRLILRDAAVLGTGCLKVFRDSSNKMAVERVLFTELLVDPNDSLYGDPRQLYQLKLVDRDVLAEMFPECRNAIENAENAYPDGSGDAAKSVSDQVMVVEGWHLPSGPDAKDGYHAIGIVGGKPSLLDEEWSKETFPFVFMPYSPRLLGFFGQGLAEQLMGTQAEINRLLMTISKSINLVGVPRVFVEDGSKVVKAHLNNEVGSIVTYRGTKPEYEVAPCVPGEVYAQLQRLVDYAYQQSGISALAASSKKPDGLDSGVALREFDDLQSDRFADLSKRYDKFYTDLSYQLIDGAREIAEDTGSYQTIYPNKNGVQEIDLPAAEMLENPFVIQCFESSSLPRDPAGRLQKITEMMQAGMITLQEGRRLLDYPDLEQNEKLANAGEERILRILDEIVDEGKYTPPDPFMNLEKALELSNQYYNLYVGAKLEEDRAKMIRTFNEQVVALQQMSMAAAPAMPGAAPSAQAVPEAPPVSPMLPIVPAV